MLSYLHAFHAGNHADILKHAALIQVIKKLNQKSAPYSFFDTHAGSGLYSTNGEKARKTGEASRGVLALAAFLSENQKALQDQESASGELQQDHNAGGEPKTDANPKSAALADYMALVRPYLKLDLYPGSPLIERALLRADASHTICELHPAEYEALKENCARDFGLTTVPRTQILKADGFKTLLAQTPPKIKRGAVLIDPSYEEASDYEAVAKTAVAVHKKWSAGIIMIWYPLLAHRAQEIERMIAAVCGAAKSQNANTNILRAEFCVDAPDSHTEMSPQENAAAKAAPRLYGSGLLVVNAPWKLDEELEAALKFLSGVPGLANAPSYSVELQ